MVYKYRNVEIYFRFIDRKKKTTNIYLHGWGVDHKTLFFCDDILKNQNSLYVDLPPFGKSEAPTSDWSIFTYANLIVSLCEKLQIKSFNLIGHSFGGRIAIIVATICKEETQKLVLIDSAGLKPHRSFKYHFKVLSYKFRKKFGFDTSKYGSDDYKSLDKNMRPIFNSIVNTHLDDFLPLIKKDTLIIFGEKDTATPLYMAKRFRKKLKNSRLVVLKDAGHFCFNDKRFEFLTELRKFVEGEKG